MYIEPTLHIHSTLAEAKEFLNTYGPYHFWSEKTPVGISDIAQGKRNLIIGEPGVGKTLLMSKLQEFLDTKGISSRLVNLRDTNSTDVITEYLDTPSVPDRALLLDGLDEVKGSLFPSILEQLEEVSRTATDGAVYISSRSVFMNRYATSFSDYRVVTISPFTQEQVKKYLIAEKHSESDVDALLGRIMSFTHNMLVVQIPRYLLLLSKFLYKNQISSVAQLSRNELFDYFIYEKLDLEDKRRGIDSRAAITKRLLEKIALTMEVYQANTISKDELMTFLDELESDLKLAALSQLNLQDLFDKSLLKDNIDSIEFDNTEFQEYLAAKEITRFPDPRWTAFAFAVEANVQEIHPSWFNALTFLVDMHPDLLAGC
jgi:energy-coupling factor transporter ATP-binding protein EcfA2